MKIRLPLFLAVLLISLGGRQTAYGMDWAHGCAVATGSLETWQDATRDMTQGVERRMTQDAREGMTRDMTQDAVEGTIGQTGEGRRGLPPVASFRHSTSSNKTAREEKRHGKSLVSPAIVADHSVPPPQFLYGVRHFSIYLPGGCAQGPAGASFLRGPPFAAERSVRSSC